MNRSSFLRLAISFPLTLLGASCDARVAAADASELEPTSTTVFGERVLLYLEHPHLVRGEPARFLAHFTVLADGEPVRAGRVTLEIGSTRLEAAAPKRDGLFVPEGALPEPGRFAARLVLRGEQAEETLDLGEFVVHASREDASRAAASEAGDEPADAVPFLLEQQWKLKLLLAQAEPRTLTERLLVPALVATPEGRAAVVTPPVAGRLVAPEGGVLARTGERVEAGATLAFVEPALGAADVAQLQALDLELGSKTLDVLRATGEAETRLRFAQRERERLGNLRGEGLSTQRQLDAADEQIALATSELAAAQRTKESLDRLVAQRATAGAPLRFALTAPISGEVVEVPSVLGASVEPGETVFRILDSTRLWVDGRVSEFDLERLGAAPNALAEFAALPGRFLELTGPPYVGREVDASSRTLLVRYELDNADGSARPGMLADLHVATAERRAPVAVPRDAVVSDQGLPTAYVMLEGELFQKRDLELGLEDGGWVEVVSGIEPGERVATRGAWFVKLAAMSPASFGAGHAH